MHFRDQALRDDMLMKNPLIDTAFMLLRLAEYFLCRAMAGGVPIGLCSISERSKKVKPTLMGRF